MQTFNIIDSTSGQKIFAVEALSPVSAVLRFRRRHKTAHNYPFVAAIPQAKPAHTGERRMTIETIKYDVSLQCNCLPDPSAEVDHPPYFNTFMDAMTWVYSTIALGQAVVISAVCSTEVETLWTARITSYVAVHTAGMSGFTLVKV